MDTPRLVTQGGNIQPTNTFTRKKGWTNCFMRIGTKVITISTAIGPWVSDRVNIFECDNVFALVNKPDGEYLVKQFAGSDRRVINSRPLVRYLRHKCDCSFSFTMDSWRDGDIILFSKGPPGKNICFHDGFSIITDTYRIRYDNSVKVDGSRIIVSAFLSKALKDRLSAFRQDKMMAFINDENGPLKPYYRNEFGTLAIKSENLIAIVEQVLGKGPWYGVCTSNGVIFSSDPRIEFKPLSQAKLKKIEITDYS